MSQKQLQGTAGGQSSTTKGRLQGVGAQSLALGPPGAEGRDISCEAWPGKEARPLGCSLGRAPVSPGLHAAAATL